MATPTETYSSISTTECQPNKPLTSELALRWRANLLASFQGASGAARLAIGALERLNAGNTQRALNSSTYSTANGTYQDTWSFMVQQGGTVRFKWEQRLNTAGGSITSYARILLTRAGSSTGYGEATETGTTFVDKSVDVTVQPGDMITFQHRRDGGAVELSEIRNLVIATGGADLWPTESLATYINSNTSLT